MSGSDWLSLPEIARRWSSETGESAEVLGRDLQAWFSAFVGRASAGPPGSSGGGDTTNVLMGLLGGRHLQRETLALYCEERGRAKPRFWFADGGAGASDCERAPDEAAPSRSPAAKAAADSAPREPAITEPARTKPTGAEPATADPAADTPAAPEVSAIGAAAGSPAAPAAPSALFEARPEPLWRPAPRPAAHAIARTPANPDWFGRPATRLAGGLALGLALLAVGYVIGHGGSAAPVEDRAGQQTAATDPAQASRFGSLRGDLVAARRQIDSLGAALDASETEVKQLTSDLKQALQDLDAARQTAPRDAGVAADISGAPDGPAALEVAALKADLAATRQTIDDLRAAVPESSQATVYKAELQDARRQIAALERETKSAHAEVDLLASELTEIHRQHAAAEAAPTRAEPSSQRTLLAAQIASAQAALSKRELAAARTRLARAEAEAKTAKAEAARLAGALADQRLRQTLESGTRDAAEERARRELVLAKQSASVHAAKLAHELAAARQRMAGLEAEADAAAAEASGLAAQVDDAREHEAASLSRLRAEAATRERELAEAREQLARLQAARQTSDEEVRRPPGQPAPARTPIRQAARPSGQPLDLLASEPDRRVVRRRPPPASVPSEAIDVDTLVANPGRYDARRVVVTGSLMRLLQHYRLQSQSGVRTLVVDVEGLDRDQHDRLRQAIADADLIGSVRARISGTVERGAAEAFRLVASDLKLIE